MATVEAWSAAQWAAAADSPSIDEMEAERLLDTCVAEGFAVRISSAEQTFYVAASMRALLEGIGALPVAGDEIDAMRDRIGLALRASRQRAERLAERARRQGERNG